MKLIHNQTKNWENHSGYSKKILLTDQDINFPGIRAQEVKNPANTRVKKHYHSKQTEIFYFLNNSGQFYVNDKLINLAIGDILVVEPGDTHYTINNSSQDFLYICFKQNYEEKDTIWE